MHTAKVRRRWSEHAVQIRFTRFGRKKVPFYRIIAIDSRSRRDGLPIEVWLWPTLRHHAAPSCWLVLAECHDRHTAF